MDDADAAADEILSNGATVESEVNEVGEGIKVARFRLPDGNILGIIENPHFELDD